MTEPQDFGMNSSIHRNDIQNRKSILLIQQKVEKSQALRTKQIENDTGSQARRNNSNEYQRSLPGLLTQARSL